MMNTIKINKEYENELNDVGLISNSRLGVLINSLTLPVNLFNYKIEVKK